MPRWGMTQASGTGLGGTCGQHPPEPSLFPRLLGPHTEAALEHFAAGHGGFPSCTGWETPAGTGSSGSQALIRFGGALGDCSLPTHTPRVSHHGSVALSFTDVSSSDSFVPDAYLIRTSPSSCHCHLPASTAPAHPKFTSSIALHSQSHNCTPSLTPGSTSNLSVSFTLSSQHKCLLPSGWASGLQLLCPGDSSWIRGTQGQASHKQ